MAQKQNRTTTWSYSPIERHAAIRYLDPDPSGTNEPGQLTDQEIYAAISYLDPDRESVKERKSALCRHHDLRRSRAPRVAVPGIRVGFPSEDTWIACQGVEVRFMGGSSIRRPFRHWRPVWLAYRGGQADGSLARIQQYLPRRTRSDAQGAAIKVRPFQLEVRSMAHIQALNLRARNFTIRRPIWNCSIIRV